MILLVDGDIFSYRAAYSSRDGTPEEAIAKVDDILHHVKERLDPYGINRDFRVFLTGKGNFRYEVAKTAEYKGNRKTVEKPIHLPAVRNHLLLKYNSRLSEGEEADDLIAIAATAIGPKKCIIVSTDKDFNQLEATIYNPFHDTITVIDKWTGLVNFYTQVLTGDTVDNIKGIYKVGPVKAAKLLEGATTEVELYQRCVEAYEGDAGRVLENGRLLWLRRYIGEVWSPPDGISS